MDTPTSQHNIFDSEKLSFSSSIQIKRFDFLPMILEKNWHFVDWKFGFLAHGAVLDVGASILAAESVSCEDGNFRFRLSHNQSINVLFYLCSHQGDIRDYHTFCYTGSFERREYQMQVTRTRRLLNAFIA